MMLRLLAALLPAFCLGAADRVRRQARPGGFRSFLDRELGIDTSWIQDYKRQGPFGVVLKGWQFAPCADTAWANYPMNVTNVNLWPKYPRFPGPLFFNISFEVLERLPSGPVELETKVRHKVRGENGAPPQWELIPCTGWDITTGCGGGGSCRYCDVMDACRKTVSKAKTYTSNEELIGVLDNAQKLCPPPKGTWSISYSKVFKLEDVEDGVLGPLQSNEYWINAKVKHTASGTELGCFRLWVDVCKYNMRSRDQKCIRDPAAYRSVLNRFTNEARSIFSQNSRF